MQKALSNFIISDPDIYQMISNRAFWDEYIQGQPHPGIVMYDVSEVYRYTMRSQSDLVSSRVQLDCRGNDREQARKLRVAVIAHLSGFQGIFGGYEFQGIFVEPSGGSRMDKDAARKWFTAKVDLRFEWKKV